MVLLHCSELHTIYYVRGLTHLKHKRFCTVLENKKIGNCTIRLGFIYILTCLDFSSWMVSQDFWHCLSGKFTKMQVACKVSVYSQHYPKKKKSSLVIQGNFTISKAVYYPRDKFMNTVKTSFSCFIVDDTAELCCVLSLCQEREPVSKSFV